MKKSGALALLLAGFLLMGPACTKDSPAGSEKDSGREQGNAPVTYLITTDYGRELLLEKGVVCQNNMTVMDGLAQTGAKLKTSYGGEFISGIEGLESDRGGLLGARRDWFYYVNGIFAETGALDYKVQAGETVWWDYHDWKAAQGTAAVIGCYPEPFVRGYRGQVKPTTIVVFESDQALAEELKNALEAAGVSGVAIKAVSAELMAELLEDRKGPTLVIGEWQKLQDLQWLADFNSAYRKNGTFLRFVDGGLEMLDHNGEMVERIAGSAGVIAATGEGNGDDSPLWLISGTDRSGVERVLQVLTAQPEKIRAAFSAVVLAEDVVKLPLARAQ